MADIVLLEDDLILADQLAEILEGEGHAVISFSAVAPALAYFEAHAVDLVIADIFIHAGPQKEAEGGVTLISKIKQIYGRRTPVLAISGAFYANGGTHDTSTIMRETAMTVGASAILAKPFTPEDLIARVEKLLK